MKTSCVHALVGAAMTGGALETGAGEQIDWGRLADYWHAGVVTQSPVCGGRERIVMEGKGGVRVEVPIVDSEDARMRSILEKIDKQPRPVTAKKRPEGRTPRKIVDPFAPPRLGVPTRFVHAGARDPQICADKRRAARVHPHGAVQAEFLPIRLGHRDP